MPRWKYWSACDALLWRWPVDPNLLNNKSVPIPVSFAPPQGFFYIGTAFHSSSLPIFSVHILVPFLKHGTTPLVVAASPLRCREETIPNSCSLRTGVTAAPHSLGGGGAPASQGEWLGDVSTSSPARQGEPLPVQSGSLAVGCKPWRIPNPFTLRRVYPRVWMCL